eukprot:evm.model.scf_1056.2 EVM.evm.TU.scf_1056.2   scf_1056:21889-23886(+)
MALHDASGLIKKLRAEKKQLEAEISALRVAKAVAEDERDRYKKASDQKSVENGALRLQALQATADAETSRNSMQEALSELEEYKVTRCNLEFELHLHRQKRDRTPERCRSSKRRLEVVVEEARKEAQQQEERAVQFYKILEQERKEKAELCEFIAEEGLIVANSGSQLNSGDLSAEHIKRLTVAEQKEKHPLQDGLNVMQM